MAEVNSRNQYIAAFSVNIISLAVGASIGWLSPFVSLLQSENSPVEQVSSEQVSWIGGLFCVGALVGTFVYGWLSETIGRFWTSILLAFPQIGWWMSIIVGSTIEHLFIGRFLAGLSAGGVFVLIPLYVAEISEDRIRGTLGSFFIFSINFGTLLSFIAGNYLEYKTVAYVMVALPIIFLFVFVFLPETPQFLLKRGKEKDAEKSLKFLRGCKSSAETPEFVKNELLELSKKISENSNENESSVLEKLKSSTNKKALKIGVVLVLVNQLSGCFALINYTAEIFMESGSSLSPNMSAIVVGIIQLAGSCISTVVVDRVSRKILYFVSCVGTMFGLIAFGLHGYLKLSLNVSMFNWVPIASLSFVIFIASIGLLPLTFIMLSEVLPQQIRSFGVSFCTAILWFVAFLLLRFFSKIVALLQLYLCMWIFSGFVFFGMIFVIFFVPETKNKSMEEIEKAL
ncbi:unnamed protein product [Diamesa hyperborea]